MPMTSLGFKAKKMAIADYRGWTNLGPPGPLGRLALWLGLALSEVHGTPPGGWRRVAIPWFLCDPEELSKFECYMGHTARLRSADILMCMLAASNGMSSAEELQQHFSVQEIAAMIMHARVDMRFEAAAIACGLWKLGQ